MLKIIRKQKKKQPFASIDKKQQQKTPKMVKEK